MPKTTVSGSYTPGEVDLPDDIKAIINSHRLSCNEPPLSFSQSSGTSATTGTVSNSMSRSSTRSTPVTSGHCSTQSTPKAGGSGLCRNVSPRPSPLILNKQQPIESASHTEETPASGQTSAVRKTFERGLTFGIEPEESEASDTD